MMSNNLPTQKLTLPAKELLELDFPEPEWLVEGLFPKTGITLLGGRPESFKSFLALIIAACCSSQTTVMEGFVTRKAKVLYIDKENCRQRLQKRLKQILGGYGIPAEFVEVHFWVNPDVHLDAMNGRMITELGQALKETGPDVVIFDSVVRFMKGNENDAGDVRKIFTTLQPFVEKGLGFILLHHTRKGSSPREGVDIRGSGDFSAMVDNVFMLNRIRNHEFKLSHEKNRDGPRRDPIGLKVCDVGCGGIYLEECILNYTPPPTTKERCEKFIEAWLIRAGLKEFKTGDAVKECEVICGRNTVILTLQDMATGGRLKNPAKGRWELPTAPEDEEPT